MLAYRVIARLDIKGPNLIKGIQFEGLRVIGKPSVFAKKYADEGADELLYIDTVASLYGRSQLESLIEETTEEIFIHITVGGGIASFESISKLLSCGGDKISINSAAILSPLFLSNGCNKFGSQAISVSIEAKRVNGGWEAYSEAGRTPSGKDAVKWAEEAVRLGAGEILITSIDQDGTRKGPDIALLKAIDVDVPVIYSGGIRLRDVCEVAEYSDGLAVGASLHYGDCTIQQIKDELRKTKEIR